MKLNRSLFFAFAAFFFFAGTASASVVVNEIAWMGTANSSNDEWIELYNDAPSPVDLTGWRLDAEDGAPAIALSGSIAANGYFLLERTSDDTVPGVTADEIYVGSMGNSGETLILKDADGNEIDTVIGGENWQNVGGDNTTKATAQRTGSGWITATGTPRAANATEGEVLGASDTKGNETAATTVTETATESSTIAPSAPSIYPRSSITVNAGDDQHALTGLSVRFEGKATGLYDEALPYATYRWNFGDGATATGSDAEHAYRFAGEYTASLEVFFGSLHKTDRITVLVSDPSVVIGKTKAGNDGFIEVVNKTSREIDMSGWHLSDPGRIFIFSENSVLAGGHSIMFPNTVTGLAGDGDIDLAYPDGTSVYKKMFAENASDAGSVKGASIIREGSPKRSDQPATSAKKATPKAEATSSADAATVLWSRDAQKTPDGLPDTMKWTLLIAGLLVVTLASFFVAKSRVAEATPADEYAIIEDIIEDGHSE